MHAKQYANLAYFPFQNSFALDVARMLRVPISWVYDHTRPGSRDPLPCLKLGKYVRFQAAAVQSYLEEMSSRNRDDKDVQHQNYGVA